MERTTEKQLTDFDTIMDKYDFKRASDGEMLVYTASYGSHNNKVSLRADIFFSEVGNILNVTASYSQAEMSQGTFMYLHDMVFTDIRELDYLLSHQLQIRQHLLNR